MHEIESIYKIAYFINTISLTPLALTLLLIYGIKEKRKKKALTVNLLTVVSMFGVGKTATTKLPNNNNYRQRG